MFCETTGHSRLPSRRQLILAFGGPVILVLVASAQQSSPAPPATAATPFSYEAVTIKPDRSGREGYWRFTPDGFTTGGMPASNLIRNAFGVLMEDQVVGLPRWAGSDPIEVQARMDAGTAAALAKLSPEQNSKQRKFMMQSLLADRFALRFHHESKELPIYELTVTKGGGKLTRLHTEEQGSGVYSRGKIDVHAISTENLAANLSFIVGRIVEDKTGLAGNYSFTLEFAPSGADASDPRPSLFTALEEQLGLRLVPSKGPVDVIVIDHIERPTEN
jgi:uncharacterized protein (TIGR03435 family)